MREHGRDPDLQLPCLAGNSGISPTVASSLQCAASGALAAPNPAGTLEPTAEARNPRKGGVGGAERRFPRQHESRSGLDEVVYWHDRRPLGTRISYVCGSRQPRAQRCSPPLRPGLR